MGSCNLNTMLMLEEIADEVESRAQLVDLLRHRGDGDYGIVLMIPGWFTTKSNPPTSRAIPSVLNLKAADEEWPWVDRKVGHGAVTSVRRHRGSRVIFGRRWGWGDECGR